MGPCKATQCRAIKNPGIDGIFIKLKSIIMEYILKKESEGKIQEIKAKPERWVWAVLYQDETELRQFGEDGIFHQLKDIDQEKIDLAVLYKFDEPEKRIIIPWRDGMKLIHKYINVHSAEQHQDINETARIYCFGYKLGGQNHYTYILPDDQQIHTPKEDIDLTKFKLK